MADEVVIGSGKTLRIGDVDWIIKDDGVAAVMPSMLTEARVVNGSIIYLSLADTVVDGANVPEVRICARLRLDLAFAQVLRDNLAARIEEALKPTDKAKAN